MFDNKVCVIKERLTMSEVLSAYGYVPNRARFVRCPFHNEKTASMKVYEKDFHCFGCGEHGDVISFVQKLFGLSFPDALKRIDGDFGLGLYERRSYDEMRKAYYQMKQLQAKANREKAERELADAEYWAVYDEYVRLEKNSREYRPKTPDEEWHPLFVEALQKMAYQSFLLDCVTWRKENG